MYPGYRSNRLWTVCDIIARDDTPVVCMQAGKLHGEWNLLQYCETNAFIRETQSLSHASVCFYRESISFALKKHGIVHQNRLLHATHS